MEIGRISEIVILKRQYITSPAQTSLGCRYILGYSRDRADMQYCVHGNR